MTQIQYRNLLSRTKHKPYKLLLISTGNIKNAELERLFLQNIQLIAEALEEHDFVELSQTEFTIHE
ncbi:MAG: hypothetical protein Fur0044_44700 [Anaerolineae bacterium]